LRLRANMTIPEGLRPENIFTGIAMNPLRMGKLRPPAFTGGNIATEFFYSGPHALISRMHLNNTHGSPLQGPNP